MCVCAWKRDTKIMTEETERERGRANASKRKRVRERKKERKEVFRCTYHHHSRPCPSHYLRHRMVIRYCAAGNFFWWSVKIGQSDLRFNVDCENPPPGPVFLFFLSWVQSPHTYNDNLSGPVHSTLRGKGYERSGQLADKSVLNSFLFPAHYGWRWSRKLCKSETFIRARVEWYRIIWLFVSTAFRFGGRVGAVTIFCLKLISLG